MGTHISRARRTAGALLSLLLTGLLAGLLLGVAAPANAEDGFRYWGYFHLKGDAFAFAETGPGDYTPEDGDVEGWRFGISTTSQAIFPRADLEEVDFEAVCGDAEAAEDEKRVAVLIDYGTEEEASDGAEVPDPVAECAVVPTAANGQQTLQAVADVRAKGAMVCGIDGYPATGCGEPVKDAQVAAEEKPVAFDLAGSDAEQDDSSGSMTAVVAAVLVVVLGGGGALLVNRRRTEQD